MIEPTHKITRRLWSKLKQFFWEEQKILLTSSSITAFVLFLRLTGLLQSFEWATLDQLFRLRPPQPIDDRILIVAVDETSIKTVGTWPIPDGVMAKLLQKLQVHKPRAIGLDIYRDLPVEPGHAEWVKTAGSLPHLIGIEILSDGSNSGVSPSPILRKHDQVGFNNVVVDSDGKVRRSLLFWDVEGKRHQSFALKLSLIYLAAKGIKPESAKSNPEYLQLGKGVFPYFTKNDGAYVEADDGGYQILANFRGPSGSIRRVSLSDVLAGKVPPNWIRDRIVLIGSTAASIKDFFYTPYSNGRLESAEPTFGVELQGHFISQILDTAQGKSSLIKVWPKPLEWIWVWGWSYLGASLIWRVRSPKQSAITVLLAGSGLIVGSYLALLNGWWLPLIPPLAGFFGSGVITIGQIAHQQEELKRSKEFLQNVINTIPDPIFVKDKKHRWIVLNETYCQFLGYPLKDLLEKSDYDFLPSDEAKLLWQQDEQVFSTGQATEHEEELTDSRGQTYLIATKRSLHKDAAGNLFLVGVIRDITARKQLEEQLKRKAAELVRVNTELRLSEHNWRHLAYHDPLTGLANRKHFYDCLSEALELARQQNHQVALIYIDLDGFKQINDSLGHDMGDLLLKAVARRLTRCLRTSDIVSRLGGDEFTVILQAISSTADIQKVADKIMGVLTQPFVIEGQTMQVTASMGISVFPSDTDQIDSLVKKADTAMYQAKKKGKNQYEFAKNVR